MPAGDLEKRSEQLTDQATSVEVSELQRAGLPQLNALLKQLRIHVGADWTRDDRLREILIKYNQEGRTLIGSGTLQILPDGFGFLRSLTYSYLSSAEDIYVSPSQIRKFNLDDGSVVSGHIRPPKENERYFALLRVLQVNGHDPQNAADAANFDDLQSQTPHTMIRFETEPKNITGRIVDLIAPIGFGQRGVIVSPQRSGKTRLIEELGRAVATNHPEAYVFCLLINERPEDVEEMKQRLANDRCEVVCSSIDESASRHSDVANIVLEKAKRMVEAGQDVVLFFDSLTDFARVELEFDKSWQDAREDSPLRSDSLSLSKRFLRSAICVDGGGSLTIVSTLRIETDLPVDDQIRDSLRGIANHEIVLDRQLVQQRIWPAINIHKSGTQREEDLLGADTAAVHTLRRKLGGDSAATAMEKLTALLKTHATNQDLLNSLDSAESLD